jgi:hypothetical protein
MKKLFSTILVLSLLLSGNAISEEINLLCSTSTVEREPASLLIDTKKQQASWQGSPGNTYHLKNGIFGYTLKKPNENTHFRHTLNRYSGVLKIELFEFKDDKLLKEFMTNVKIKLDAAGKSTKDTLFFFRIVL